MPEHFDVIIIGTGAGGGTILHELAGTGKRILVLERGPFLPRETGNWDTRVAFHTTRYFGPEVWLDRDGNELRAGMCYHVGDNLYVVDGGFFVSSAAVNPTLTIIANALRVGAHLRGRLGATPAGPDTAEPLPAAVPAGASPVPV